MINSTLRHTARQHPERAAILLGDERLSYRDLAARVAAARSGLARLGVGAGDGVFLALPNCPEFVIGYLATAELRASVHAIDPQLKPHELSELLRAEAPVVAVVAEPDAAAWDELLAQLPSPPELVVVGGNGPGAAGRTSFADLLGGDGANSASEDLTGDSAEPDAPWVYTRTSGSTGEPRLICRSQGNQAAEAEHIVRSAAITGRDVLVCPVPLFHALGQFCCMIVAIQAGATLVLVADDQGGDAAGGYPAYVGRAAELIRQHRASIFIAVPYIFEALADLPAAVDADLSSLRLCLSGSNFLPATTQQRFAERFGVPIRQTYGSSEAGSVCWDLDPQPTPGSVGRPLAGVQVSVVDEAGQPLAPGAEGEILVRSAAVMRGLGTEGYLTGDLGHTDPAGRLYITGRKRILIDTGGHKVNPVEVEKVLQSHPAVREAAVVGLPVRGGGNLLAAAVIGQDVSAEQLREFCRDALADYKVPVDYAFVTAIPRSPLGKVRRAELVAALSARQPGAAGLPPGWREQDAAGRRATVAGYLAERLREIAGTDEWDEAAPLRAVGLDSLGALRLRMAIQDALGVSVGLPELLGAGSLGQLLGRLADTPPDTEPLPLAERSGELPMSYNQLALWHADQLAPDSAAYNLAFAARVSSGCDSAALRSAFQLLADRNMALRTSYGVRAGRPFQRVAEHSQVDFEVVQVPAGAELAELLNAAAYGVFDLQAAPPVRVRLFQPAGADPVLLVSVHHIATDFWSTSVLLRELGTGYAAALAGTAAELPDRRHDYADYVRWLTEQVEGPRGERDWQHWQQLLDTPVPALEMPRDHPRPPVQAQRGATYLHSLAPETVAGVRALARGQQTTAYTVLLASFLVLVQAYTAETDLAVAMITTNRQRPEFEEVLGYFVNPVVCRVRVSAEQTFTELLAEVREQVLAGIEHQTFPFEQVVERLGLKRDRSRAPLVELAFGQSKVHDESLAAATRFLSGAPGHRLRTGPLELESVALTQRGMVYDFSGAVQEGERDVSIAWEYSTDLYRRDTVERIGREFERLARRLAAEPELPLGKLLLTEADLDVAGARLATGTLPELIAELAGRQPDRPVLRDGARDCTAAELSERAEALAGRLRAAGVAAGDRVALALPSSVELAVAGLAVLRLGAVCEAIRPVDDAAQLPDETAQLPDETAQLPDGTALLLTSAADAAGLVGSAVPVLAVDAPADAAELSAGDADERAPELPDEPAMVLRSAGVTGQPRRVPVPHRALLRQAELYRRAVRPDGSVLIRGALAPDAALHRMLAAVAAGARVELAGRQPAGTGHDPEELARLLSGPEGYDLVELTPGELAAVLAVPTLRPTIGRLLVGGEVLHRHLAERWLARTRVPIVHWYGSAEAGGPVAAGELTDVGPADPTGVLPVGTPLPGVGVSVLDPWRRPCPAGVPGRIQLDLGGSAARPASEPELLDTGDLGRLLPDGRLVVLGRPEQRCTVRGYRADLAEVAGTVSSLPEVVRAIVLADPDTGRPRAYLELAEPGRPAAGLREELRRRLPEYLVPADLVAVDRLPTAANGKLRLAAPEVPGEPTVGTPAAPEPFVTGVKSADEAAPSPVAAILIAIWQEVLNVPEVGPDDDYFDLDGDSITAMRIVSAAAEAGIRITPRQLFTFPTVRTLAEVAEPIVPAEPTEPAARTEATQPAARTEATQPAARTEATQPAARTETAEPVPLSPVQHWFFDQQLAEPGHWNQVLLLRVAARLGPEPLTTALIAVAARHPALRLRFSRTDAGWQQHWQPAATPVTVVRLPSGADPVEQAQALLDLTAGPLLAAALLPADDGWLLCLAAHHLVVDFVSWQVLLTELGTACGQLLAGEPITLPEPTLGFPDWCRRLTEQAGSPALLPRLPNWLDRLAPSPDGRLLTPAPAIATPTRRVSASLDPAATAALLRSRQARGHQILLAAAAEALADWEQADDVYLDVEGHGREPLGAETDLSRSVGWFTSSHPVHVRAAGAGSPLEQVVAAPGGIDYGMLRYLCPDAEVRRRLAALPPATVSFNYLGSASGLLGGTTVDPSGLFTPLPVPAGRERSSRNARRYRLEISALVSDSRLVLNLDYGETTDAPERVAELADRILAGVRGLVPAAEV